MTSIVCDVCPRACRLEEGKTGYCGVRTSIDGENRDLFYRWLYPSPPPHFAETVVQHVAYLPGCNLRCPFCVFPFLSSATLIPSTFNLISERELIDEAEALSCAWLTFFGGEPTLHYEYVLEGARLCRERNIKTLLATNGYISPWLAEKLGPAVDLPVVGIKASASREHYAERKADSMRALEAARIFYELNRDTRITDLIGPGLNATSKDDEWFGKWICDNISPNIFVIITHLCHSGRPPDFSYASVSPPDEQMQRLYDTARRLTASGLANIGFFNLQLQLMKWNYGEPRLACEVALP